MKFVTGYTNHFHSKIFRKENEVIVKVRRYKSQGKNDGRTMEITVKDEIGVFDNYLILCCKSTLSSGLLSGTRSIDKS